MEHAREYRQLSAVIGEYTELTTLAEPTQARRKSKPHHPSELHVIQPRIFSRKTSQNDNGLDS